MLRIRTWKLCLLDIGTDYTDGMGREQSLSNQLLLFLRGSCQAKRRDRVA